MKMTNKRPTTPGWYWYELPGSWPRQPVLVFDGGPGFGLMYTLEPVDRDHDDSDRDGLEMAKADSITLWSSQSIQGPDQWREAKHELPPEGDDGGSDDVLVACTDGTMSVAFFDYAEEGWMDRFGYALPPGAVTHWQPLPPAPPED